MGGRWAAGGAELCQLDKYGGVGAFAQFGVKDAAVKPKKWSRIVTTVKLGREQVTNTTAAHKRLSSLGCVVTPLGCVLTRIGGCRRG